jgi:hypothetical protein
MKYSGIALIFGQLQITAKSDALRYCTARNWFSSFGDGFRQTGFNRERNGFIKTHHTAICHGFYDSGLR